MTSTFAPPTGPPVTGSPMHSLPAIEPVPVGNPPNGRRRFALVVAVVAVLALGAAAFTALAGGRWGDGADVAEAYSLSAAAESTITARTVEFDLTVSVPGVVDVGASGAVDNESQLMTVTTDLSSLLALGDAPMPMPFGGGEMTVLVDGSTRTVYLDAASLGGFLGADAAWVSIDLGVLAEQSGQTLDDLEIVLDPADVARALLDTDDATEIGVDTIDGVEVKHYRVAVNIAAALGAVPQAEIDPALADVELPATVDYDVWVTADSQLRRVAFDTTIAGQSIAMQLDVTTSADSLDVELPDASDVFDLTGLLGF